MHLGQCYQQLDKPVEACFYLDKALEQNPNNANFYVAKAQFLIERGEGDSAEQCLRNGINLLGYLLPLVIKLGDYLMNTQRHKEVGTLLGFCSEQSHIGLAPLRNRLALQNDYAKGIEIYHKEVKEVVKEQSQLIWLAEAVRFIDSGASEVDLLGRVFSNGASWQ
jgi:tetratricopeptide (TPR) repeat protein